MVDKSIFCPFCKKRLIPSRIDINRIGYVCSHKDFDVKIYKEFKIRLI